MRGDAQDAEAYLSGQVEIFTVVDGWIRRELGMRYRSLHHEQDDLAQTVHEKLLVSLRAGRFRGQATLRSYVTGIVHYAAIDRLRVRYRDRALSEDPPPDAGAARGRDPNPYDTLEARENAKLLHQVIQSLPDSCRELWKLVLVDKLPYEKIAKMLSIPPGTVKSRMWNCRRKAMALFQGFRRTEEP